MVLKKKGKYLFTIVFLMILFCACGRSKEGVQAQTYKVYYVNSDETAIFSKEYVTQTTDTLDLIDELLAQMSVIPERLEYKAPISGNVSLLKSVLAEGQLTLSFDEAYKQLPVTTEVLIRAAIVRTVTQVEGVSYVAFQIKSEPLTDASGTVLGFMNADLFIDNAGDEINTYERVKLSLYLANESGDGLKKISRSVVYNSNISMERLIVEQLILGALENEKVYPTVNPNTRIISVNVKDGICYVDLDNTFLTQIYNVTSDVTIYSITNSLVELSNVNKVQISINGDINVTYRENTNLSTVFERNLELVE